MKEDCYMEAVWCPDLKHNTTLIDGGRHWLYLVSAFINGVKY